MRISDWSSDVCSSDLCPLAHAPCTERPLSRSHSFRDIQLRQGQAAARLNATGAAIAFRATRTGGRMGFRRGAIDTPWDPNIRAELILCQYCCTITVLVRIAPTNGAAKVNEAHIKNIVIPFLAVSGNALRTEERHVGK